MQHQSGISARHSIHVLSLSALSGLAAVFLPTAADAIALDDRAICEKVAAVGTLFLPNPNPILSAKPLRLAQAEAAQTEVPPAESEEDLVNELNDMLQACSYDGKAIEVSKTALSGPGNSQGEEAVRAIMRFTGLPQNFTVVEANVPNAAAMIVVGPNKLPRRVIAYNARFIDEVREATARNDWAPVSIMAHEIGHHLSGHTLMPGGSQPPVELEADKFSGFVLFKMGATLAEAQKAIQTLVPEADGPTHPGRSKRLAAVQSGWSESCDQQPNGCAEGEAVVASAPPVAAAPQNPAPASPAQPPATQPPATQAQASQQTAAIELKIPGPADIRMPGTHPASKDDAVIPPDALDRVPRLDASATPSKFDRFVYDEIGVFHPQIKQELSQRAYAFAARHDLEIVTVVTKDLQGREPDRYALDLMRQLRVGKLEVGNGAVLVVAPNEKRVGVAMGPGLAVLYQNNDLVRRSLQRFLDTVEGGGRAQVASDLIVEASSTIMRNTVDWEWTVRYPSLESMMTAAKDYQARRLAGEAYDPARNPTYRKLVRLRATVVSKTPPKGDRNVEINAAKEKNTGPAMHVRDAQGRDAVLYVSASVPTLMPSPLEEGREYAFVVRDTGLVAAASPQFDLVSYDLLR